MVWGHISYIAVILFMPFMGYESVRMYANWKAEDLFSFKYLTEFDSVKDMNRILTFAMFTTVVLNFIELCVCSYFSLHTLLGTECFLSRFTCNNDNNVCIFPTHS